MSEKTTLGDIHAEIRECAKCGLCRQITNKVPGVGPADADVMIIGEAPGANEDIQGKPFVGRAGEALTSMLEGADIDRDRTYVTNVLKCRPPQNRNPAQSEIDACVGHLEAQIRTINPTIIITLGLFASQQILHDYDKRMMDMRGQAWTIACYPNAIIIPTYHPAYMLRNEAYARPIIMSDLALARQCMDQRGLGMTATYEDEKITVSYVNKAHITFEAVRSTIARVCKPSYLGVNPQEEQRTLANGYTERIFYMKGKNNRSLKFAFGQNDLDDLRLQHTLTLEPIG